MLRASLFCVMALAGIASAEEDCLVYAPTGDWLVTTEAPGGAVWPVSLEPLLGVRLGARPVEACRQLAGFDSDTEELESADPRFPAVVHWYADFVPEFVGLAAPMTLHFRGQRSWSEIPEIAVPDVRTSLFFSAPPSGSQLLAYEAGYRFTNGSGRLPSTSEMLLPIVRRFGQHSRISADVGNIDLRYEWLVKDGTQVGRYSSLPCSIRNFPRFPAVSLNDMPEFLTHCDGVLVMDVYLNDDVPEFVDRVRISVEDRNRIAWTKSVDAAAADNRSAMISRYVQSPDGELNVRRGPSGTSAIRSVLRNGDRVWVGGTSGNWSSIASYDGLRGWVFSDLLVER